MLLAKNILQCNCLLVVQTLSLIVFLLFISGCSSENEGNSSLPNVVVILTDDQGWGDLSLTGNTNFSTPNIDRLAREGALLENFYVSPVCSPTRAEFLTGRYHTRSGVYSTSRGGEMIDLDEELIAEIFKRAGYKTAAYGKWHNGTQAPYHPNSRGFDDFYGFCSGHWGSYFDPMLEHNGELTKGNGYLSDDLTDKGINFINNNKDQAFFLYLPYNTPHSPMQVPQNLWDKYKDKELVLRYSDPAKENLDETRAALAMCENIDWNIGRIRESLEENGLLNNTIIVFFSDNGPAGWRWNNGFKGKKGSVDEGGVRSPGIVNWPDKISAGTVVNAQVSAIDLLPTLVSLTDIDHTPKNPLDGKDFSELLFQRISEGWHDRLIVSYWNQSLSLRNSQFRLDEEGKLYDMISDPGQTQNVASKYKQIRCRIKKNFGSMNLSGIWKTGEKGYSLSVILQCTLLSYQPETLMQPEISHAPIVGPIAVSLLIGSHQKTVSTGTLRSSKRESMRWRFTIPHHPRLSELKLYFPLMVIWYLPQ